MNTDDKKLNKRKYESRALKRSKKNREALLQCENDKNQTKINFFQIINSKVSLLIIKIKFHIVNKTKY